MKRQRLFVDMDGTLAVFNPVAELEELYEEGYFKNLSPMRNVLDGVRNILSSRPEIEVYILSSYFSDSRYALEEKKEWIKTYIPEMPEGNCIFVPCGMDKAAFVPGGIRTGDYLLDDYSQNLKSWEPPAKGIKLLNGINGNHGTWKGERISYERTPEEIEELIVRTMKEHIPVYDALPKGKDYMRSANRIRMEYENSEDKELYQFIQDALDNKVSGKTTYELQHKIEQRLVNDIRNLLGIETDGFSNMISKDNIVHIIKRHGIHGTADHSMADLHKLAKIEYVLQHYDKVTPGKERGNFRYKNSDNTPAQTILLQKAIDEEYYYVVEAVPNNKAKSLYVTSAYIQKNDSFVQEVMPKSLSRYVQNELKQNESFVTDNIAENKEKFNQEHENNFKI